MDYWGGYAPYVSVGEKRAKAQRKLKQLQKKNPDIKPIVIEGSSIAKSWWSKSWNSNLERYADYSNRIGRGRSYVRHGAVLDLKINPGEVNALVQGSSSTPYSITVKISKIKKDVWGDIKTACEGKLESLSGLLMGKFSKDLVELFTKEGVGLFPSPKEIKFDCSCPDWASMCKHVAATLYGIGARLDDDPNMFFELRKADVKALISETVKGKSKKLIEKANKKSSPVIADADLSSVFGIEFDDEPAEKKKGATKAKSSKKIAKPTTKNTTKKKTATKKAAALKKSAKETPPAKKAAKKSSPKKLKTVPKKGAVKKLKKVKKLSAKEVEKLKIVTKLSAKTTGSKKAPALKKKTAKTVSSKKPKPGTG